MTRNTIRRRIEKLEDAHDAGRLVLPAQPAGNLSTPEERRAFLERLTDAELAELARQLRAAGATSERESTDAIIERQIKPRL